MKLSNEAQQEQLKEIVAHLRQVREEKSIRLEEIAAYTHIRLAFLQALDEGRFEELPEPVYVKGFIRHYADAVGLDGTAIAQTVANVCSSPKPEENDHQELEKKPNIYVPLVVPYALLLGSACFGLFYILNTQRSAESFGQKKPLPLNSRQKTASIPKASSPAASPTVSPKAQVGSSVKIPTPVASSPVASTRQSPIIGKPAQSAGSPTPTAPPTDANSPLEVAIELQDQSWLRVKVDGKTEFEGTLKKGERKTWTAKKELIIRSGNAGAVLVSANKKQPTPLGKIGTVKQVTLTSKTVNSQ